MINFVVKIILLALVLMNKNYEGKFVNSCLKNNLKEANRYLGNDMNI